MLLPAESMPFGEKMLWAAVLRRAVFDYVLYKGSRSASIEWKRALQYIFVRSTKCEGGLTFEEVCGLFGWDPDYLRRLATKLTRADIKKMETTQMREDFTFDLVGTVVDGLDTWEGNSAVPFFPAINYISDYQERMTPQVVYKEELIQEGPPLVSWELVDRCLTTQDQRSSTSSPALSVPA